MARNPVLVRVALAAGAGLLGIAGMAALAAPEPEAPAQRARWNVPVEPFRIAGDTWYVGPRGLTVLALRTSAGVILIDAALPESVPQILANLAQLGIAPEDVRLLVSSHAHFDHAGGFAELKARTGAELVATEPSAALLAAGGLHDLHFGDSVPYPAVDVDRVIADRDVIRLGDHELTALVTPGHTPGSTTWTWHETQGDGTYTVVYADSLSAPGYQLVGNDRYPDIVADFLGSADRIGELPCDVLVTPHPEAVALFERLSRRKTAEAPLVGADDCAAYARRARNRIERIVAEQTQQVSGRFVAPTGSRP